MSVPYRPVVFFRKIASKSSAQVRHFRPSPSVWLSDWLSNAGGLSQVAAKVCKTSIPVSNPGRRLQIYLAIPGVSLKAETVPDCPFLSPFSTRKSEIGHRPVTGYEEAGRISILIISPVSPSGDGCSK